MGKEMLLIKFGSFFNAWRKHLDVDQNGFVTQKDFSEACRQLGIQKVKQLWNAIDKDGNGQISLIELDAETASAFGEFESLLVEKYGHTKEGWRAVFVDPASDCTRCLKETFVQKCRELGYSGDAGRLFTLVRPDPFRSYLIYEDLWLNLNPNDYNTQVIDAKSPLKRLQCTSSSLLDSQPSKEVPS